jgi:hypothetical protein
MSPTSAVAVRTDWTRGVTVTPHKNAVEKFKATFLCDDIDGFMELIDPDCEWTIMATGERKSENWRSDQLLRGFPRRR